MDVTVYVNMFFSIYVGVKKAIEYSQSCNKLNKVIFLYDTQIDLIFNNIHETDQMRLI